jgi:hypothetical protein
LRGLRRDKKIHMRRIKYEVIFLFHPMLFIPFCL